jgi:hypothetical protein
VIETKELKGLLELVGGQVMATIQPKTGEILANIDPVDAPFRNSTRSKGA